MAEMMRLQIVTPDEAFFDGEVSMVELNTATGKPESIRSISRWSSRLHRAFLRSTGQTA